MHADRYPEGNNSGIDIVKILFHILFCYLMNFIVVNATQRVLIPFKLQGIFLPASCTHGFAELLETQPQKYKKGL